LAERIKSINPTLSIYEENKTMEQRKYPDKSMGIALHKKLLETAINDAQYLIKYAATKYPQDIDPEVIKTLIEARDKGELEPGQETAFWLAYHKLSNQLKPVTAESIKANLPAERHPADAPTSKNPLIVFWRNLNSISKVRKAMNWRIFLAGIFLLTVLFFQIYWVIGNQLSTQLGILQQEERDLSPRTYEDPLLYEKDLKSLKTQRVQTTLVFLKWSNPWIKYVSIDGLNLFAGNTQRIAEIDARLKQIDKLLLEDPNGTIAAANDPEKQSFLLNQLVFLSNQITDVQEQINILQDQKSAYEAELAEIKANRDAELRSLTDQEAKLISDLSELRPKLIATVTLIAPDTSTPTLPAADSTATNTSTPTPITATPTATNTSTPTPTSAPPTAENPTNVMKCLSEEVDSTKVDQALLKKCTDIVAQLDSITLLRQKKSESTQKEDDLKDKIEKITENLNVNPNDINDLKIEAEKYLVAPNTSPQSDQGKDLREAIRALPKKEQTLGTQLSNLNQAVTYIQSQVDALRIKIANPSTASTSTPDPSPNTTTLTKVGAQIIKGLNDEKISLEAEKYELQIESIKNDSGPAQLAGRFVLDILEKYLLPFLYGILGAVVYVLRSLSRQIRHTTYSEATGIQHISHISLGALSGILVGWFSNLFSSDSFISSVSPMAIAFLVGYNIELAFSKMDEYIVARVRASRGNISPVTEDENQNADSTPSQTEDSTSVGTADTEDLTQ